VKCCASRVAFKGAGTVYGRRGLKRCTGAHGSTRVRGLACTGHVSCGRTSGMVSSAPVLTPIGRRSLRIWARSPCRIVAPTELCCLCVEVVWFWAMDREFSRRQNTNVSRPSPEKIYSKIMSNIEKISQTLPGCVQGSLAPHWYLDFVDSSFEKQRTQLIFEKGSKFRFLNF
jgi:hypothetical protein